MNKELSTILDKFPIDEILQSFDDIPFGNSDFQIENFIINAGLTPERAFRSICLNLRTRLNDLSESYYNKMKLDVDLEELKEKIGDQKTNKFDKRRAEIELEQKIYQQNYTNKLIKDAIHEVEIYYKYWKMLPHPNREDFEKAEEKYFLQSMYRQIHGITGPIESLQNMGYKELDNQELTKIPKLITEIENQLKKLENI